MHRDLREAVDHDINELEAFNDRYNTKPIWQRSTPKDHLTNALIVLACILFSATIVAICLWRA